MVHGFVEQTGDPALSVPIQLVNVDPVSGVAVMVTEEPVPNKAEHIEPQFMPLGTLVIVPVPVPDIETLRVSGVVPGGISGDEQQAGLVAQVSVAPVRIGPRYTLPKP